MVQFLPSLHKYAKRTTLKRVNNGAQKAAISGHFTSKRLYFMTCWPNEATKNLSSLSVLVDLAPVAPWYYCGFVGAQFVMEKHRQNRPRRPVGLSGIF